MFFRVGPENESLSRLGAGLPALHFHHCRVPLDPTKAVYTHICINYMIYYRIISYYNVFLRFYTSISSVQNTHKHNYTTKCNYQSNLVCSLAALHLIPTFWLNVVSTCFNLPPSRLSPHLLPFIELLIHEWVSWLPGPSRAVSPKCLKLSNSPTPIVRHDFPHIKLHFDPSFGVSFRIFFLRLPASQPSRTSLRKVRSSTSSDHGSLSTDGRFCTWGSVHHDDGYYC